MNNYFNRLCSVTCILLAIKANVKICEACPLLVDGRCIRQVTRTSLLVMSTSGCPQNVPILPDLNLLLQFQGILQDVLNSSRVHPEYTELLHRKQEEQGIKCNCVLY